MGTASLVMLTTAPLEHIYTHQSVNDSAAKLPSSGGLQYGLSPTSCSISGNSWSIYAMMINVLFPDL